MESNWALRSSYFHSSSTHIPTIAPPLEFHLHENSFRYCQWHNRGLADNTAGGPDQEHIFEPSEATVLILKWVWAHDPGALGYLFVVEHIGVGADPNYAIKWPSLEWDNSKPIWERKHEQHRFHQRMVHRARKERAKPGQKRAKIRMPGE
jgi:hypothetical protein